MRHQPRLRTRVRGSTRAILRLLAPAVVGEDPRQVELVAARMDAVAKGYAYAKSAIDIACWDLFGRATGLRVSDLLGGTHQEEFPLYTGVGIAEADTMRRGCLDALAAGYDRIQIKVGHRAGARTSSGSAPAPRRCRGRR